ncbi:ABC transporter substrate-binding protein [Cellulomonas terrae]|uniref:ABC transporter substrate-binding protein n=1 Tax=Cellulomonas terrae TaxID=311234 RepID=A0A511JQP5_9CELL|nr:ABC transporter substrate-binding protein [Cellulomonas terrae]GEM00352.1 ABC transporter substrate-binding protein [Cellulomonas terrae]
MTALLLRAFALAALVGGLAACSDAAVSQEPSATITPDGRYPVTLDSPFGTTELTALPERVAVVSAVDLDIALALGIVPVTAPKLGDLPPDPWTQDALANVEDEVDFYDSTDGTDHAAIAASEPDVILATGGRTLAEDYEQLATIAPVVSFRGADGLTAMTWAERTVVAAEALGLSDEGAAVVDGVQKAFADARAAHPQLEGKSCTYAVVHPDQITYVPPAGSDVSFFTDLGLVPSEAAAQVDETDRVVSTEDLGLLDADVLLVGYPFGDGGLFRRDALEADERFRQLPAVASGHYAAVDDVASPLAHPSPLSRRWALQHLLPVIDAALAGS